LDTGTGAKVPPNRASMARRHIAATKHGKIGVNDIIVT
jgi:hypothetical protein